MTQGPRVLFDAKEALAVYPVFNKENPFAQDDIDEHLANVAPEDIYNVQACLELLDTPDPDPQAAGLAVEILQKVYGRISDEYLNAMATVWTKPRLKGVFWWQSFCNGLSGWAEDIDTKRGRDHFRFRR